MNFATFRNKAFLMLKYWSPLTLFLGYLPLPFMGTEERSGANLHFLCLSQTWVSMFVQRIKISDSPREWLTLCLGTAGSWTPCHLIFLICEERTIPTWNCSLVPALPGALELLRDLGKVRWVEIWEEVSNEAQEDRSGFRKHQESPGALVAQSWCGIPCSWYF